MVTTIGTISWVIWPTKIVLLENISKKNNIYMYIYNVGHGYTFTDSYHIDKIKRCYFITKQIQF